jgi:hypothetical protein
MVDAGAAVAAFRRAIGEGEEARALRRLGTAPQQKRAMEQFARAVARAPDIKTALRDPRVLEVIGKALGIPEASSQPGLAQRALLADPADRNGLLARLPDQRWKSAAETLNLKDRGIAALRDPQIQARLAEGLQRAAWRVELEEKSPGLGDAVLFRDKAAQGLSSPYEVLGNPVLRRVVTTALGLPPQLAVQSVEAQLRAVTAKLELDKLRDPRLAQRLAERYLVARAGEAQQANALTGITGAFLSLRA